MIDRPPNPEPDWWPDGVSLEVVRDCNCEYCDSLLELLGRERMGRSLDGDHQSVTAITDGGGMDGEE